MPIISPFAIHEGGEQCMGNIFHHNKWEKRHYTCEKVFHSSELDIHAITMSIKADAHPTKIANQDTFSATLIGFGS